MAIRLNKNFLKGFISQDEILSYSDRAVSAQRQLNKREGRGSEFHGWTTLPTNYDRNEFSRIQAAAAKIRKDSDVLIVIGIGGSYLGSRAVIDLLGSPSHNRFSSLEIYFSGYSFSGKQLNNILRSCEGKRISLNVISKSGTTTECAVAFRVLRSMMEERYGKEGAAKRIYATTDESKGMLKELADREGYECFVIPDDIGGRYSVLTAVGLLPIAAAGYDIEAFMRGAQSGEERFSSEDLSSNEAMQYAVIRNLLLNKGKIIEILASFEPAFARMSEWFKQLFGESEGKDGKGIFPASVIYSTDLHSMGQYIQDGNRILFETVVRFKESDDDLLVEPDPKNDDGLNFLAGRSFSEISEKAADATAFAHCKGGVPNLIIEVDKIDEENIGELIYFFERACAISGYILGVNPFDQPGVEEYKKNMFALLGRPGCEDVLGSLKQQTDI